MKNPIANSPAASVDAGSNGDLEAVLEEVDNLDAEQTDEEDEEIEDQYVRTLSLRFPDDVRHEYGINGLEIPIRKILEWASHELPEEAERLQEIRLTYYGGDQEEDYFFGADEFSYATNPPTMEELAEKRFARKAGRQRRESRRSKLEIQQAQELIDELSRQIERHEGRLTLLDKQMMENESLSLEIGERRAALQTSWDNLVAERAAGTCNKKCADATREMLNAMEAQINEDFETRSTAISAAYRVRKAQGEV
ncbi:MAG: hypothetical protein E5W97_21595 [Mesorhizobium sp.]|nr:MAG: hypothetical protein E5W97_21595 [Mesorhizobium sp.]